MNTHDLANQLRKRLQQKRLLPEEQIANVSDIDVITSYVTCGICGEVQLADDELVTNIELAKDAADFLSLVQPFECCGLLVVPPEMAENDEAAIEMELSMSGKSVWNAAHEWATATYEHLQGETLTPEELTSRMNTLCIEWSGEPTQKWLFIWSPESAEPLFEVGGGLPRTIMALTKLQSVSSNGGMIFGLDGNEQRCEPLAVAAPGRNVSGKQRTVSARKRLRRQKKQERKRKKQSRKRR